MSKLIRSLAAGTLVLCSLSAAAEEYLYSGVNYTAASGSYNTGLRMSGSIQTSSPIPANAINLDVTSLIDSFSFSDGVNTLTNVNGEISPYSVIPGFLASTDADGEITAWALVVRDVPIADAIAETNIVMITSSSIGDAATPTAECTTVNLVPTCTFYDVPPGDSASAPVGSWSIQLEQGEPVPTLTGYSLALSTLGLLVLGARRLRRRS